MAKSMLERLFNRMIPLDKDYKKLLRTKTEYIAARRDALRESTRIERAANDKILAEQEEKTALAAKRRERLINVATYDAPHCVSDGKSIEFDLILQESEVMRKITVVAKWEKGGAAVSNEMLKSVMSFAMNQSYWNAWMKPWLDQTLELDDLRVLKGFRVVGEKLKEPHPDAYSED